MNKKQLKIKKLLKKQEIKDKNDESNNYERLRIMDEIFSNFFVECYDDLEDGLDDLVRRK